MFADVLVAFAVAAILAFIVNERSDD